VEHTSELLSVYLCCTSLLNFHSCICFYLKLVDPIESRCKDDEFRAQAIRELLKCIVDHRTAAKYLSSPERDAVSYLTLYLLFFLLNNINCTSVENVFCASVDIIHVIYCALP
jgi:hypothetical protein